MCRELQFGTNIPGSCRSSVTIVTVAVVLANNLGPEIPAPQYQVKVSEGVDIRSNVFSVPVSHSVANISGNCYIGRYVLSF